MIDVERVAEKIRHLYRSQPPFDIGEHEPTSTNGRAPLSRSRPDPSGGTPMSDPTVSKAELDAAESVLADAFDHKADGYWRSLAADILTAADSERTRVTELPLDALYGIMMLGDGAASEQAAAAYHEIKGLCREAGEAVGASMTRIGVPDRLEVATGDTRR